MRGIQSSLPRSFEKNSGKLKTDTLEDFQNIIKLLRQVPRQIDQIQTLLEKGTVFQRAVLELSHLRSRITRILGLQKNRVTQNSH